MRLSVVRKVVFRWPGQGKPMVYPVTYMACLSQLPAKYMFKNVWFFRYMAYSYILCLPLWAWIQSKVNSPEAVAAWDAKCAEDKRKEHLEHMWADIQGRNANKY